MFVPIVGPVLRTAFKVYAENEPDEPIGSAVFYEKLIISVFLVLGGGVFAG